MVRIILSLSFFSRVVRPPPGLPFWTTVILTSPSLSRFFKLQCMENSWDSLNKPNPLGVKALSGLFILLGCGLLVAIVLLIFEHAFYKYLLPSLRNKPRENFWRSRRVMFFSQVTKQYFLLFLLFFTWLFHSLSLLSPTEIVSIYKFLWTCVTTSLR